MRKSPVQSLRFVVPAAWALIAAGCATPPAGAPGSPPAARSDTAAAAASAPVQAGAPAARAASAAAPPPGPGQPPSFANVIKDAKKIDGALTLWQKDDK